MTSDTFPFRGGFAEGPFRGRRAGRGRRDERARADLDQGGFEQRRERWSRGFGDEPPEHHGRGPGRHGGDLFGFGPGRPGPDFWGEHDFGRGPRRGRGRAGRGDVRAAIIALLAEEPRNGYQIIQEIEQRTDGMWRASSGSVYPALSQLEDEGLIEPVGEGGRKLFTLTEAGRRHAEQHAEHLTRIWQEAVGPGAKFDEMVRDRTLIGQLVMAYRQVAQVGSAAQHEEARAVLTKARQALYKILAADDPQAGESDDEPNDAPPAA